MELGLKDKKYAKKLLEEIDRADAICIGGASGMSAASGYTYWYQPDQYFQKQFKNLADKYGYKSAFDGLYYRYNNHKERWAFFGTLNDLVYNSKTGQTYYDIAELVKDKNYFVVTTNQDGQFSRVFPEEKVAIIQGDWRYMQCNQPCHDKVYDAVDIMEDVYHHIDENCEVPEELIPKCPKCGEDMEPWVRGYHFLEGQKYEDQYRKWLTFLEENKDKNILFLELGVGRMTPMFIQQPFWKLTYEYPNAYYISINPKDALMPPILNNKGTLMHQDIAKVLKKAVEIKAN